MGGRQPGGKLIHRFLRERIPNYLVVMTRPIKQMLMLVTDAVLLVFAVWAAYSVRLGEWYLPNWSQMLLMAVAPVLAVPIFLRLGLYRSVIRYLGEQALWSVLKGMSLAALLWAVLAFMTQMTGLEGVPRAVPFLYWLIGFALVAGSRFGARWLLWFPVRSRFSGKQVLIYGAGNAGRQLAESLRRGRELFPAGFLDDDRNLHGKDVGGCASIHRSICRRCSSASISMTSSSPCRRPLALRRREVVASLKQYPVRVRILPALTDIANGRHLVNMVREVDVGDLLGRDSVAADPTLLGRCITGKAVLVTGAGGSIGSELCRQIAALQPGSLILLDASEHALYQIHRIAAIGPRLRVGALPRLGR
jgi:FlaA1/EpsC-like NDP-sugar epimerase